MEIEPMYLIGINEEKARLKYFKRHPQPVVFYSMDWKSPFVTDDEVIFSKALSQFQKYVIW